MYNDRMNLVDYYFEILDYNLDNIYNDNCKCISFYF